MLFDSKSLLCRLRELVVRFCDGTDRPGTVPQEGDTDTDEVDPMNESVLAEQPAGPNTIGVVVAADTMIRARCNSNAAKHSIVTVYVPRDPPEVDPNCTQMRPVKLFINDRKTLWLHVEDVAWAADYLFAQTRSTCVPAADDNDPGPSGAAVTTESF